MGTVIQHAHRSPGTLSMLHHHCATTWPSSNTFLTHPPALPTLTMLHTSDLSVPVCNLHSPLCCLCDPGCLLSFSHSTKLTPAGLSGFFLFPPKEDLLDANNCPGGYSFSFFIALSILYWSCCSDLHSPYTVSHAFLAPTFCFPGPGLQHELDKKVCGIKE